MAYREGPLWLCILLIHLNDAAIRSDTVNHVKRKPNAVLGINTTCTADTMNIRIVMSQPFHGIVYARGFPTECKSQGTGEDPTVSLHLPAMGCGVRVMPGHEDERGERLAYLVTVEIQLDRHLQQAADQQRTVMCHLPPDSMHLTSPALSLATGPQRPSARMARKQTDIPSTDFHHNSGYSGKNNALAWMEIYGAERPRDSQQPVAVGEQTVLLIKSVIPERLGIQVTDCIAHDGAGESSQRLIDANGCPIDEMILPALDIFNDTSEYSETSDQNDVEGWSIPSMRLKIAGAIFPAFKFPDRDSLHLRCILQLCRESCPRVDCMKHPARNSTRQPRRLKGEDGEVLDRFEVFNSVEVLAPGIELDDLNGYLYDGVHEKKMPGLVLSHGDRAFCLSPPKMALAFGILGLIFLCAVTIALYMLMRGRRRGRHTKLLLSEETLTVHDSPFSSHSSRIQWPYIRVMH